MEQTSLYSNIDQASDALERLMINAIASLERNLDLENNPSKIAYINSQIIASYEKLQAIKSKMDTGKKVEPIGVFDRVMKQLSSAPKLADKAVKHTQLKAIMAQAQEFELKEKEDEQND